MIESRAGNRLTGCLLVMLVISVSGCASSGTMDNYHDPNMDFSILQTIGIMPFANLTRDKLAAECVRDALTNNLLATGAVYVVPPGEVARGITRIGILDPTAPSLEEVIKLAAVIKVNAIITGTVREYGELRSGTTSANVVSVSARMIETQSQRVVWTASSSKGGIRLKDRLLGGGGRPMNDVTEAVVDDLINKLFQ